MHSSDYSYQKLPPPLEEYIPAQSGFSRKDLPEHPLVRKETVDKELLEMLVMAAKDEREAQEFYRQLGATARTEEERAMLLQVRLDEQKHEKLFCEIYKRLTGSKPEYEATPNEISRDHAKNYEMAFFGELHDVEFYRKILFSFQSMEIRDMIYEIITDEQSHAMKLLYLR